MVLLVIIGFILIGELIFLKLIFSETRIFNQKKLEDNLPHEPGETEAMAAWINKSNQEVKRAIKDSNRIMFCIFYSFVSAILFIAFNMNPDMSTKLVGVPEFVAAVTIYFMYSAFKAASHMNSSKPGDQNAPDQFFDGGQ